MLKTFYREPEKFSAELINNTVQRSDKNSDICEDNKEAEPTKGIYTAEMKINNTDERFFFFKLILRFSTK